MNSIISRVSKELKNNGVSIIPSVFSDAQCREYVSILDDLIENAPDNSKNRINEDVQSINNYFRHHPKLMDLVHIPIMDELFKKLIGKDHVLISANTFNRSKRVGIKQNTGYEHSKNDISEKSEIVWIWIMNPD